MNTSPKPTSSPWGEVQQATEVAPGMWWVSTASHGGFLISQERFEAMPANLKAHEPFAGPLAYEEDCDWCIVVQAFPELFENDGYGTVRVAQHTFDACIAPKLAKGRRK